MRYLYIAGSLSVLWLLLSGHFIALILFLGGLSVLGVTLILWKMDKTDAEPIKLRPGYKFFHYLGWLFWQVVLSNIDVARRIWSPSLPIEPCWEKLDTEVSTTLEKTLYANSITLTPGTLTTDVSEDHFMIHSLSPEGIEDLRKGEMQRRILKIGLKS